MKKIILLMKKASMSSAVASFALMFGVMASTRNCFYILHQPEMPADMKKLRKF
ncbi:MAG: cyclic lactone autoinducer peptide [Eubacteriales bacterium]